MTKDQKPRISGKEATQVAMVAGKYPRYKSLHRTNYLKAQGQTKQHLIFQQS
jgi:hypothetical protein